MSVDYLYRNVRPFIDPFYKAINKKIIFTLLGTTLFLYAIADNPKKKTTKRGYTLEYSNWSVGITGGPLGSYRWLYDNPRYTSGEPPVGIIYNGTTLTFNDKKFIEYRNKYEKIRWGSLWGINLEYKLNPTFSLQFGSNIYGLGEKIYTNTITETEFKNLFGSVNDTVKNTFWAREFPLILKFNIAPHSQYDLSINRGFLSYKRHLIGMAGVGIAKPVLNRSYYRDYIHFGEGNTMVNAIAGLGLSQQLSNRFNITLSSVFRYSFTPAIEYSSIDEYYYSFGLEANLRYTFARKIKRNAIGGRSFDCFDPRSKPAKKLSGPKLLMGVISGLNISSYWGADIDNEKLGLFEALEKTFGDYTVAEGRALPKLGPHIGLHFEYNFADNAAAIATELQYSQKGMTNRYTYSWTGDPAQTEYMNTIIKTNFDYLDVPLFLKIRLAPKNYVLAGGMFSFYMGHKIMAYYQHFDSQESITGSTGTDYNYGVTSFSSYFHSTPTVFVKGFMLGYELNIDDNVDLNFRIQQTDNLSRSNYKLFNITGQISLIYMFNKREKTELEE